MRTIPKPAETAKDVFLDCVSTVDNAILKQQYEDCADSIEIAEADFEFKFPNHQIYEIPQNLVVFGPIGKEKMNPVYDYRMVNPKMPGNKHYNKIKSAASHGKCPLCSVRTVDSLDHYLPKSKYPIFAVTPINLIPACTPCNKGKHIDYPSTDIDQTLHPYYDNVENEICIKANVLQTSPISFEYYVDCPDAWSQILKDRTANHFNSFNLNELFSSHASEELRGAKKHLMKLYNDDPSLLHDHLAEAYDSRIELGLNSWQAGMYSALLSDVWFCTGGVLL